VRLKWPNDIYTAPADYDPNKRPPRPRGRKSNPTDVSELKKLGGVLVSTNFSGGEVDMIVGALMSYSTSFRRSAFGLCS
jgi:biotin-(acetyl-CoA carboxylase) ligase